MDKELIDRTWSCLPKEFKEEVKESYRYYSLAKDQYDCGIVDTIETIFGKHNLTSDAEGEEMLTVSRKGVQGLFDSCNRHKRKSLLDGDSIDYFDGEINILTILFGSKCLPNNDANEVNFASKESKFKVGDIASYVCSPTLKHKCTITEAIKNEHSGKWEYNVMFEWGKPGMRVPESALEPYTEPEERTCTRTCTDDCPSQSRNLSQETANCDKRFDNVLKDSFSKERRLNIAAMVMQGLLASPVDANMQSKSVDYIVKASFEYADALIAESEKGGRNEKA